jgi:hypothetical protein
VGVVASAGGVAPWWPSIPTRAPRVLERAIDGPTRDDQAHLDSAAVTTVEAEVRARVAEQLGGARGSVETVLPFALFTLVFVLSEDVGLSVGVGIGVALAMYALRLVQRASTQFVRNGLVGIGIGAVFALASGRAETAFLPGIIQSAAWALGLGVSILVRWPAAGFLVGAVLGDTTAWRDDPAIVRLSNRLTLCLLVPMVVRVAVQYPLYAAGEVGWLGVSRIALGWPLSAVAFAVAAGILARGRTPIQRDAITG